MRLLSLKNVSARRGDVDVLRDVTFEVGAGEVVGLVGPNGAGKTTLMRAALGLLPHSGASTLAGLSPRERARKAAWLPQTREIAWPVSVATLVALGRTPYLAGGRTLSSDDERAVAAALNHMGLVEFADRTATELSGGEQARVLIARVLAQEAPLIMADEPVAGLDPAHQFSLMRVFRGLAEAGQSVVVSLHDLGLAARHCTRLILLDQGRVVADGSAEDVLSDVRLSEVFGIAGHWADVPGGRAFHALERQA